MVSWIASILCCYPFLSNNQWFFGVNSFVAENHWFQNWRSGHVQLIHQIQCFFQGSVIIPLQLNPRRNLNVWISPIFCMISILCILYFAGVSFEKGYFSYIREHSSIFKNHTEHNTELYAWVHNDSSVYVLFGVISPYFLIIYVPVCIFTQFFPCLVVNQPNPPLTYPPQI